MISKKHNVLFIHIPKTGGQSVELMFLKALGLGWAARDTLLLRKNNNPAAGPARLAHLYADEYVKYGYVSQDDFDSYFKFTVVRNPYDRIASEYLYRFRNTFFLQRPSPEDFLLKEFDSDFDDAARHLMPQTRFVRDENGKMLVDRIVRFENLKAEMELLSSEIFGIPLLLPHRNKSGATGARRKDKLKARLKAGIAQRYHEDFEFFGYEK